MNLSKFANKNIHVIGTSGAEGSAIVEFLATRLSKPQIIAHDFCTEGNFKESFWSFHDAFSEEEKDTTFDKLQKLPVKFNFQANYLEDIEKADIVFVPQSWFRYKNNQALIPLSKKIPFYNITKLYFNLCPCPIIAVTGTSGKSTTTRLIYEILKKGGQSVYFTGNDRQNVQVLNNLDNIKKNDVLVMEVSNRQLKIDQGKSPHVGVITNISPNHLDDHQDYQEYIEVKKSLLRYQNESDFAVLNYDNNTTRQLASDIQGQPYYFSQNKEPELGCFLKNNDIFIKDAQREYRVCQAREIVLPGPHNLANVLAASLAAFLVGSSPKNIRETVTSFTGLPSRLELVKEIKGVKYYEDSAACNPEGTSMAVQSFKNPIVLIAGGSRKVKTPNEYQEMAKSIAGSNVKALLLLGEEAANIEKAVRKTIEKTSQPSLLIKHCSTLEEAVSDSSTLADTGDIVILSPGCESFGMFKDYRDRGRQFKILVKQL